MIKHELEAKDEARRKGYVNVGVKSPLIIGNANVSIARSKPNMHMSDDWTIM